MSIVCGSIFTVYVLYKKNWEDINDLLCFMKSWSTAKALNLTGPKNRIVMHIALQFLIVMLCSMYLKNNPVLTNYMCLYTVQ
jgi:hypothetical protein